jgi:hypothetical protein
MNAWNLTFVYLINVVSCTNVIVFHIANLLFLQCESVKCFLETALSNLGAERYEFQFTWRCWLIEIPGHYGVTGVQSSDFWMWWCSVRGPSSHVRLYVCVTGPCCLIDRVAILTLMWDLGEGLTTVTVKITTCGMWHRVFLCVPTFQANRLFPGWVDVCATALATRRFIVLVDDSMEQSPSWKPTGPKLIKKFPAFYGIQTFITLFTKAILV